MSKKLQKRENSKRNLRNLKVAIAKVDSRKRGVAKKEPVLAKGIRYSSWFAVLSLYAYMMYRLFAGEN